VIGAINSFSTEEPAFGCFMMSNPFSRAVFLKKSNSRTMFDREEERRARIRSSNVELDSGTFGEARSGMRDVNIDINLG